MEYYDGEQFNANAVAEQVMSDWLFEQFETVDLVELMTGDPDCPSLLEWQWDAVLEALRVQKLVSIHLA